MTATARIIVTGRNRDIFPSPYVVCRECGGSGNNYEHPIDPSARPTRVSCPVCNGDGVVLRKRTEPIATAGRLPVAVVGRPVSPSMRPGRPLHAGMKPDSVAATVSRQTQTAQTKLTHLSRVECSVTPAVPPNPCPTPPGSFFYQMQEVATVLTAIAVFGGLAFFCLVIAS